MKFAYVAAALLGFAYANPILDTPVEDGVATLETREEDVLPFLEDELTIEEREENADLMASFDEMFAEIEERFSDFDEFEEEEGEIDNVIEARSVKSVLGALKNVDNKIKGVNKALSKFGNNQAPSNRQALAVQKAGAKLKNAVESATGKTKNSRKVGGKGSKKIFGYVKKTLAPAAKGSLQKFIEHAPGFKKTQFAGLVKKNLNQLKGKTGSLGKALLSKTKSKKIKKQGKKVLGSVQAKFNQAINKY